MIFSSGPKGTGANEEGAGNHVLLFTWSYSSELKFNPSLQIPLHIS